MRFKPRNIEFCKLMVYLIINYNVFIPRPIVFGKIVMLNIKEPTQFGPILLCVWKLCEVRASKHRILQLNCLFNNYNFVIPRSILLNSISMLKKNTLVQFEPITTLRLEAMPCLSPETSNFAT